jgi:hypothetical protein
MIRCRFYIDASQHCAWTEDFAVEPFPGDAVEHDGHRYLVNPNPVRSWSRLAQPTVLLAITSIDAA